MNITWDREVWRDSPVFPERYEVSSHGNIRSKSFIKQGRNMHGSFSFVTTSKPLAKTLNSDGYFAVRLSMNGVKVSKTVHRLVAIAFIPEQDSKPYVNHKDSNRKNNNVLNLEWCTAQENIKHGYESGSNSNAKEKHPQAIYTELLASKVRELIAQGHKPKEVGQMLNMNYWSVIKIKNGRAWV